MSVSVHMHMCLFALRREDSGKGKKFALYFPSWQGFGLGSEADVWISLLLYTVLRDLLSDSVYYSDTVLQSRQPCLSRVALKDRKRLWGVY